MVNRAYSVTNVLESERYIDDATAMFLRQLAGFVVRGITFNVCEWLTPPRKVLPLPANTWRLQRDPLMIY
jgi:hypothetical protein